jgi:hypothetical protein
MSDYSPEEIQRILAEAREEKLGYLRGKGWTDAQIAAYFAGRRGVGWLPPYWKYPPFDKWAAETTGARSILLLRSGVSRR